MRFHAFRHLLAGVLPLFSLSGAALGFRLFLSSAESAEAYRGFASVGVWPQIFTTLISALICTTITLWWVASYFCYFYQLILFKFQVSNRAPSLPLWAPSMLKILVSGSIGMSLFVGPQHAHASTPEGMQFPQQTAITAPIDSQEARHDKPQLKPIGSQGQEGSSRTQISPSLSVSPLFSLNPAESPAPITVIPSAAQRSISPLFGGGIPTPPTHSNPGFTPGPNSNSIDRDNCYTVQQGDSLWAIAEKQMPRQASGSEILHRIHEIQRLNSEIIPTLDTFIFPGQQILLPLNTQEGNTP